MLLKHCKTIAPKHEFSFKRKMYSLDATLIELCVCAFPWATYRQTKGAIKLNMLFDHDGHVPVFNISQSHICILLKIGVL